MGVDGARDLINGVGTEPLGGGPHLSCVLFSLVSAGVEALRSLTCIKVRSHRKYSTCQLQEKSSTQGQSQGLHINVGRACKCRSADSCPS